MFSPMPVRPVAVGAAGAAKLKATCFQQRQDEEARRMDESRKQEAARCGVCAVTALAVLWKVSVMSWAYDWERHAGWMTAR